VHKTFCYKAVAHCPPEPEGIGTGVSYFTVNEGDIFSKISRYDSSCWRGSLCRLIAAGRRKVSGITEREVSEADKGYRLFW